MDGLAGEATHWWRISVKGDGLSGSSGIPPNWTLGGWKVLNPSLAIIFLPMGASADLYPRFSAPSSLTDANY